MEGTIQYENLTIRKAVAADAKQLAAWWNDGAVMAHAGFPNGLGTTEEEVIKGLGKGRMVIAENDRLIGECNYRDLGDHAAEIGIKICETDCQNRGVGRKVLSMLIQWLFANSYTKIILDTNQKNQRAQHVYESLGFRKVRTNVDAWRDQLGQLQTSIDYELVEKDFISYINFYFEKTEDGWKIFRDGSLFAAVTAMEGAYDTLKQDQNGWRLTRKTAYPVSHMTIEVAVCGRAEHIVVPAVSYDGNPFGHDHEYKGWKKDGIAFTYASHRTAVPGGTWSSRGSCSFGMYGTNDASGCVFPEDDRTIHRLIWPETEEPEYLMADGWGERYEGTMEPTDTFTACLFFGEGEEKAERLLMSHAWNTHLARYGKPVPMLDSDTIWDWSVDYAKRLYTEDEADRFRGFSIGYTWKDGAWRKRPEGRYEIGWCGQNASIAVSLIEQYRRSQDQEALQMGLNVLDDWTQKARSREGLLLTRQDVPGSLIDACNLGTAGLQYLEAWKLTKELGMERTSYLETAKEICEFTLKRMDESGRIGMSWNQDGSVHEREGTAGAFLILPLAAVGAYLDDASYLCAAKRAFGYYFDEFSKKGFGTSGALDTSCIDKESVIPLLKGAILLYDSDPAEEDEKQQYRTAAEAAAWYLSTWQYHHSVSYPADSVLGKLQYDTFGGTSVSTSHLHQDPFALSYVLDLFRLSEITGNEEWRSRGEAAWYHAAQEISDGTLTVGSTGPRFKGSCDEGYLHTCWGTTDPGHGWGEIFSTTQWLVAWPCAFRLEILRKRTFSGGKEGITKGLE